MTDDVQARLDGAATELFRQHQAGEDFSILPPDLCPRDFGEAYRAQAILMEMHRTAGGADRTIGGYKVALTSPAMQALCHVDEPAGAAIFADLIYESGVTVRHTDYVHLGVESEMAMRLSADLPDRGMPYDQDSVADAVGACMAAIEIIEDRNVDYDTLGPGPSILTGTADLGWNRGCVLGAEVTDWQALDLGALPAAMEINGKVVGEGHGRDALGHPLNSLAWVANHQISQGNHLRAGDIVMTGSVVTSHWLQPGDVMRTVFERLGEAKLVVV